MAQQITTADVYRGTFHCQTCGTELTVFYCLRCPKCHAEFTLLSGAAQDNPQERTTIVDNKKSWFHWIYNFNFTHAFILICEACDIEDADRVVSYWRHQQENMDAFEAEVFLLNYFGVLE